MVRHWTRARWPARGVPVTLASLLLALALAAFVRADVVVGPGGGTPGTALNFALVGHNSLFDRGMNAALTIYDHYVYIGNRTDASLGHVHPGIQILDIVDPSAPTVVGEITGPTSVQTGITTRELRVWPRKKLLIVMTFGCSPDLHHCPQGNDTRFDLDFYDLGDPLHPRLLQSHVTKSSQGLRVKPHEFFLWVDPKNPDRALIWASTPTVEAKPAVPNLLIEEISAVPDGGPVRLVAEGNWNPLFPGAARPDNYDYDLFLHSMTPSFDGTRTYLAYLRGGFGVLDTSKIANNEVREGTVESLNDALLTPVPFPTWGAGKRETGASAKGYAECHSALPFPGRPFALTIDEVYGTFASHGWPWGWARVFNIAEPKQPQMVAEYKLLQNTPAYKPPSKENQLTSYSSHDLTLTRNLAFVSWHSGGLQAIDISNPATPAQAGWFSPMPLAMVATEDPALSSGPNKVVMWSFPIVKDGLIYVNDIRNGLYVLRYTGPFADEVAGLSFLEGNSNLGEAGRINSGG
jgi:hypothetical protein